MDIAKKDRKHEHHSSENHPIEDHCKKNYLEKNHSNKDHSDKGHSDKDHLDKDCSSDEDWSNSPTQMCCPYMYKDFNNKCGCSYMNKMMFGNDKRSDLDEYSDENENINEDFSYPQLDDYRPTQAGHYDHGGNYGYGFNWGNLLFPLIYPYPSYGYDGYGSYPYYPQYPYYPY